MVALTTDLTVTTNGLELPQRALASKYLLADGTEFDWNNPAHAADPYKS